MTNPVVAAVHCAHRCRSVFYSSNPRPLSHLVGNLWRGPTLVLQGTLDPLNDAKGRCLHAVEYTCNENSPSGDSALLVHPCRACCNLDPCSLVTLVAMCMLVPGCEPAGRAEALQQCCPNVDVKLLNAGHCPHDEAPAAVNEALLEFLSCRSSIRAMY